MFQQSNDKALGSTYPPPTKKTWGMVVTYALGAYKVFTENVAVQTSPLQPLGKGL